MQTQCRARLGGAMEVGLGARQGRRWRRSSRLEVEAPWGDPPRGPCASCGRAWRATRGGVGEGGGASRRRMPQARPRVASGGVGPWEERGLRHRGGQAEAAGPGRRALPQPRAVDSPSRRRLGGGLDRRRRCAAVVVAWSGGSGGGGCACCVEAAGLGSGGGGCAVGGGREGVS